MQHKPQNLLSLSAAEKTRYSRHILLPEVGVDGQAKLKSARVLVIGTGGLGSPASLYLAAAGVGCLGLVECDTVDRSNLQRQILYIDQDVGFPKLAAASARLRALAPDLKVEAHEQPFAAANATALVANYDIVIDGTDNFATRYLVNDTCVLLRKPNVYGSIFRFDGQASLFDATKGPCYRCLFPAPPPADQVPNCAEGGVLGVLPGLIGMIQATETLKLIMGIGTSLIGRLLAYDAMTLSFQEFKLGKSASCPACGENSQLRTPEDLLRLHAAADQSCLLEPLWQVAELSAADFSRWRSSGKPHVLVDVRNPGELQVCRIEGSTHIPLQELENKLGDLPREVPIVVHCKSGARSAKAAALLHERGFAPVFNLQGGILAWIDEIDPTLSKY